MELQGDPLQDAQYMSLMAQQEPFPQGKDNCDQFPPCLHASVRCRQLIFTSKGPPRAEENVGSFPMKWRLF